MQRLINFRRGYHCRAYKGENVDAIDGKVFGLAVSVILALIGVVWTMLQGQISDFKATLAKKADKEALDNLADRQKSADTQQRQDLNTLYQRMDQRFDALTELVIRSLSR
jgi:hypothetical protein